MAWTMRSLGAWCWQGGGGVSSWRAPPMRRTPMIPPEAARLYQAGKYAERWLANCAKAPGPEHFDVGAAVYTNRQSLGWEELHVKS